MCGAESLSAIRHVKGLRPNVFNFSPKGPLRPPKNGGEVGVPFLAEMLHKLACVFKTELHIPPPVVQKDVLRGMRGLVHPPFGL